MLMNFVYNLRNCVCLNKEMGGIIAGHLVSKTQSFDRYFLNNITSGSGFGWIQFGEGEDGQI